MATSLASIRCALDGAGNKLYGARWNSPGRGVVYTSENLSLCVLETYVHFSPAQRESISAFEAVQIQIPDDAERTRLQIAELRALLAEPDFEGACRRTGDAWLAGSENLILATPSTIVPEELNIMLNPAHPRMAEVAIVQRRQFQFDPRLIWIKEET